MTGDEESESILGMDGGERERVYGNPRAVAEFELHEFFARDPATLVDEYVALFYDQAHPVRRLREMTPAQRRLFSHQQAQARDRIAHIVAQVDPGPGDRIVDIGSGSGCLAYFCARRGARVVALDHDPDLVRFAKTLILPEARADFPMLCGDATHLPLVSGWAGKAVLGDVFEHIGDQRALLAEVRRVLSPGGRCVIHTDNEVRVTLGTWFRRAQSALLLRNPLRWNPAWSGKEGGHIGLVTLPALCGLVQEAGLEVARATYFPEPRLLPGALVSAKMTIVAVRP